MINVSFSGLCSGLHQYQFIDEPKTWSEAQQYCREKFTDLATVDNMEDVDQLIAAAGSGYSGKVWIGLYDNSSSWAWSMTDDGYYGTNNQPFLKWYSDQPGDRRDEWKLCSMAKEGLLINYFCVQINLTELSKFLPASSPPTYVFKAWRNLTWEEAQSYCRKFHTDLASIRNEEEKTLVQKAITGNHTAQSMNSKPG
ncbi:asialoglycoprotein receptor 2-like [Acanthochromis polyacanthus]|uniref:asialoglycoprotein receptor 2-like n=1 Tax=Acanthochromis polyacanthus TaxID=80966 RepID=UPI002233EB36|nr:asialoglycoprotein receptor 2-like [Acanthochromis polyacanthus]